MRSTCLLLTLGLLVSAPAWSTEDGWNDCRANPNARCLANLAFTIGKTLPEQDAARYKLAEEQSKQNLRDGLGQLLAEGQRPLTAADHISHLAELGDMAKARALLGQQTSRADRAQGYAVLATAEAARRHLRDARDDLKRGSQLARKLKGQEADLFASRAAQAQMELGSDSLALETAGQIADTHLRFQAFLALSQRMWELKRKDSARAALTAAENTEGADSLAVARQWRLYGDEDGFRRALENAEKRIAGHKESRDEHDLSGIAVDLSQGGDLNKLHDRISRLPEPLWRAQSLVSLANALPPAQSADAGVFLSEAADIATRIAGPSEREVLESQLVHGFSLLGDRTQATRHLSQLKDPKRRADAFIDLASLRAPKSSADAASLFDQAKDEIEHFSNRLDQDIALRDLIWAERRAGQDDLARKIPNQIADPLHHLLAQAEMGEWTAFDKEVKAVHPSDHDLQAIASGHAIEGRFADVLETVKRIGDPALRAETLASSASLAAQLAP